ncbi:MAG TPA: hypothetical protein VNZ94_01850 [Xanthobacteraceae bacterium]|nr:hypothetical protein [Xanthobacteraceae bacterium]
MLDAYWGNGEDAGLLRLEPAEQGEFRLAAKAKKELVIDLGVVDRIPRESFAKVKADARCDDGAIIVTLPAWAHPPGEQRQAAKSTQAPVEKSPAKPSKSPVGAAPTRSPVEQKQVASEPPAPAAGMPPAKKMEVADLADISFPWPKELGGIRISSMAGRERIILGGVGIPSVAGGDRVLAGRGGHVDCSPRAAKLVALLAKAEGRPIDEDFCIRKLWDGATKPPGVSALLDMIVSDLKMLRAIGLEVRKLRGVGLQLAVLP